jgi:hypothetical protein
VVRLTGEKILQRGLLGGHRRRLLRWFPAWGKLRQGVENHDKVYGRVSIVSCVLQRRGEVAGGCTVSVSFSASIPCGTERVEGFSRRAREREEIGG